MFCVVNKTVITHDFNRTHDSIIYFIDSTPFGTGHVEYGEEYLWMI